MAHLTKQRQLTFLVLCHIWYSGTSRLWLQGPDNTSSLPFSLGCCGGSGGGGGLGSVGCVRVCVGGSLYSRQTVLFECKASAAANPLLLLPSAATATLLLFCRISQLFLNGRTKPSKDLHWRYVIKTRAPPHVSINIKIKELYEEKMSSEEMNGWNK